MQRNLNRKKKETNVTQKKPKVFFNVVNAICFLCGKQHKTKILSRYINFDG